MTTSYCVKCDCWRYTEAEQCDTCGTYLAPLDARVAAEQRAVVARDAPWRKWCEPQPERSWT